MNRHAQTDIALAIAACSDKGIRGTTVSALAFDIAACTSQGDKGFALRFLPVGEFRSQDGRPAECAAWRMTPERGQQLAASLNAKKTPVVIDYEHQTLHAETNGKPAPASGWCQLSAWEMRADGLYAHVDWTPAAAKMIDDKEYKFFSPVFGYNKKTGDVSSVLHGALTNSPALDGFTELYARAAAKLTLDDEDTEMPKYLKLLLAALALKAEATEDDITAALTALTARLQTEAGEGAASCSVIAVLDGKTTAIAALKTAAPDPAKFMPMDAVAGLQTQLGELNTQIAALKAGAGANEVDTMITAALTDGRLVKATESWARDLGKKDPAVLKNFLDNAPKIAALSGKQTDDRDPDQKGKLSDEEVVFCKRLGIDPVAFLATKTADEKGAQA